MTAYTRVIYLNVGDFLSEKRARSTPDFGTQIKCEKPLIGLFSVALLRQVGIHFLESVEPPFRKLGPREFDLS